MTTQEPTMIDICALSDLSVERGAAALIGGDQVAVFRLVDDSVRACQQRDPYSGTNVLSRGLVGSHEASADDGEPVELVPTIASPMYKQVWNLDTGEVLDAGGGEKFPIAVHEAEVRDGRVLVSVAPRPLAAGATGIAP
ncbi:nitrite reductase small subunit NirD [Brachybacterium sp. Z12]|uniref:nitrite reductase small subunit NirD n=1 Tax=Brachybacterium sp. Z12 TaxID=2759167 RepID=UPI0018625226|nr:nitrite reductase small subunit NirD [Brachybacterium sp. Z12]QNN81738.1 nitrite reductase small subunit NirD [Brachybacterium sp. Z12]